MSEYVNGDWLGLFRNVASTLPNALLAGIGITSAALVLARVAGRGNSRLRFSIWMLALAAIVVLSFAGALGTESRTKLVNSSGVVFTLSKHVADYVFAFWVAGAAIGLAHIGLGLMRLGRVRKNSKPVDVDELDPVLRTTLEEVQRHRAVTLWVSDAVRVPSAIGYFRPMVVVPGWVLAEIPADELNSILLHELAHLRRYDDWTNLAQKVIKAVFFFHPAVWYIESQLSLEREMACDEAVLANNCNAREYAESLVGLAEKSFLHRGVQLVQAAVSHVSELKLRIIEILRPGRSQKVSGLASRAAVAAMSVTVMVAGYGVVHSPRWIAFSEGASAQSAVAEAQAVPMSATPELRPVDLSYSVDTSKAKPGASPSQAVLRKSMLHAARKLLVPQRAVIYKHHAELPAPVVLVSDFMSSSSPNAALVVVQERYVSTKGNVIWTLTVMHVTPVELRTRLGEVPKKI